MTGYSMCCEKAIAIITVVIHASFTMSYDECRNSWSFDQSLHGYSNLSLARVDMTIVINSEDSLTSVVSTEHTDHSTTVRTDIIHSPYLLLWHICGGILTAPAINRLN